MRKPVGGPNRENNGGSKKGLTLWAISRFLQMPLRIVIGGVLPFYWQIPG